MFATALGKNQPDRSYYKSLYKFNPKVELAEYSLPFYDNSTGVALSGAGKVPSGVLNTAKLPPLDKEEAKDLAQDVEEGSPEFERADEEQVSNGNLNEFRRRKKRWKSR